MNKVKTLLLIIILSIVITDMINARRLINSAGATSRFPRKERRISPVVTKPTFLIKSAYRQHTNSNHGFKKKSILHQSLPSYHQGKQLNNSWWLKLNFIISKEFWNDQFQKYFWLNLKFWNFSNFTWRKLTFLEFQV